MSGPHVLLMPLAYPHPATAPRKCDHFSAALAQSIRTPQPSVKNIVRRFDRTTQDSGPPRPHGVAACGAVAGDDGDLPRPLRRAVEGDGQTPPPHRAPEEQRSAGSVLEAQVLPAVDDRGVPADGQVGDRPRVVVAL